VIRNRFLGLRKKNNAVMVILTDAWFKFLMNHGSSVNNNSGWPRDTTREETARKIRDDER